MKSCNVPECDFPLHENSRIIRGLCPFHYDTWRKRKNGWLEIDPYAILITDVENTLYCACRNPQVVVLMGFGAMQCRICKKPPLKSLSTNAMTPEQIEIWRGLCDELHQSTQETEES